MGHIRPFDCPYPARAGIGAVTLGAATAALYNSPSFLCGPLGEN